MSNAMAEVKIGLIGGTGLGQTLGAESGQRHDVETPYGAPSSAVLQAQIGSTEAFIVQRHGEGHLKNPTAIPYRANIYALKSFGVTHIVASGATGSLREEIAPRDLVIVDQLIDKTHKRANTFFEEAAVHVEFSTPFCPVMRSWLLNVASEMTDVTVHEHGTYVCMEGPAFSTEAESHMHRAWGGDLVGMTAMPEAKLAREAEMAYALVALPTDYDCWRPHPDIDQTELLKEIIGNVKAATGHAIELIQRALANTASLAATPSPAHDALKLGIWSDIGKIPREVIEKHQLLWGRYLS